VYVIDFSNSRIQKFTDGGVFLGKWGTSGTADGQFDSPEQIAFDPSGNIYVADDGNARIQKFAPVIP
jgi:DNA-binding beta-propeller fold protein YncE